MLETEYAQIDLHVVRTMKKEVVGQEKQRIFVYEWGQCEGVVGVEGEPDLHLNK